MEVNNQPHVKQMTSSYPKPVKTRQSTDRYAIILFPINLLIWLGIGIYYIHMKPKDTFLTHSWIYFVAWRAAAVYLTLMLITLLSKLKKKIMFVTLLFIFVCIVFIVLIIFTQIFVLFRHVSELLLYEYNYVILTLWLIGLLVFYVICLIYHILIFIHTKKVDKSLLAQMINEPSCAILGSLPKLLFSFLIVLLFSIVLSCNMSAIYLIRRDHVLYTDGDVQNSYWFWLRILIFGFSGTYIFNFVYNFGFTVMGDYFANYYSSADKQKGSFILQSIKTVLRYHLGTVSLLSIPILPSVYALIMNFQNDYKLNSQSGYFVRNFISKACLIMDIPDYATLQTSIYGHPASKSINEMCDLRHSNSLLFLITNAASFKIAGISTICTGILGIIVESLIIHFLSDYRPWKDGIYSPKLIAFLIYFACVALVYLYYTCNFLVRPAMCTFSIYKMTSLCQSEQLDESLHLQNSL